MLASHVLVPPAIAGILDSAENRVRAFLGPGNVCTITGYRDYEELATRYRVPIVVTGFEPIDLLQGILMTVRQLESGRAEVENQYIRGVVRDGNRIARELVDEVFEIADRNWRGIGKIPRSGLGIRETYGALDAERLFPVSGIATCERSECISGRVLRGQSKPSDCPAFGGACTPATPLGATMVSSEGACAAYFAGGRHLRMSGSGAANVA
jgi:hydrogenase expression/formation protein HypD